MNIPNALTCLRIVLTFVFLFLLFLNGLLVKILALVVFLAASITDYWDGKIARSTHQVTAFGRVMDPIADKFLALSAFIGFSQKGLIAAWMVVLVAARDFLITGIRLAIPQKASSPSGENLHAARSSGKNKTVLQFVFILFVLSFLVFKETAFWNPAWEATWIRVIRASMAVVVIVTLWSGTRYLIKNRELFE